MKFNPDMLWQSVPKQVFAIQFTGDNLEEVKEFTEEHRFTTRSKSGVFHVYLDGFHVVKKGYWIILSEDCTFQAVMDNEDFLSNYTKVKG